MLQDIIILERVKDALSASTLPYIHPISQEEVSPYLRISVLSHLRCKFCCFHFLHHLIILIMFV